MIVIAIVVAFWMDAVVSPYAAIRSLLVAVVGAAAVTLLASLLLRNRHAGGLAVTALIGLLYTKHLVRLVEDIGPRMHPALLALWLVAVALAAALAARLILRATRHMDWSAVTWLLNRFAVILLIATIGAGLFGGQFLGAVDDLRQGGALPSDSVQASGEPRPDIYVVLLDGYPRADVLQYAFDYDNTPFLSELERRGFEIADEAHSDYLWTQVSLSSLLHMEYVENIESLHETLQGRAPLYPALYDTVNHNPVFDTARREGYQVVAVSGGFEQLAPRQADVFLDSGAMNEFELKLLNSTFLGQIVSFVAPRFAASQHGDRIRASLDLLGEVARAPHSSPRLVFAHVPTPHQPAVFDSDGTLIPVPIDDNFYADSAKQKGQSRERFSAEYRAHLTYVNQLVVASLDEVLEASALPPVFVFLADHGSASRVDWLVTQPEEADPAHLLERTGTFFAALTPGRGGVFPEDISPASVFRHLFDAYAGTSLGPAVPPEGGGQVPPVDASVLE